MQNKIKLRNFHEAKWDEPIVYELSATGQRGILYPFAEEGIVNEVGDIEHYIPASLKRKKTPNLPEIAQPQVLRHYLRLSQETLGQDLVVDIGLGTCTMKYSPKINEQFVRNSKFADLHPLQDEETTQGILEIIYKMEQCLKAISGMDAFSFQPGGGGQAVFSNASVLKAYYTARGEDAQRNEIITTMLSHPVNAATPATKGFKVITLMPDPQTGCPSIDALKAAVSEHTAGLFITNPEDTGIFNDRIREMVDIVHAKGGLCIADQADYNGLYGITRARDAGFDMCHFNLHKSFASPHGCMGPCCGAQGVKEELAAFLPKPRIKFDGQKYYWDYDSKVSVGKVRKFYGVIAAVLRAYAWTMAMGAEGLREVADTAIINNNYLMKKMLQNVKGLSAPWQEGEFRMEQVRYSWEKCKEDTGVGTEDMERRAGDYGLQSYFLSHHPWLIPEPFTPEPTETYSKADLDEYAAVFEKISEEAYTDPELVKNAPYHAAISKVDQPAIEDPQDLIVSWRVYKRKKGL